MAPPGFVAPPGGLHLLLIRTLPSILVSMMCTYSLNRQWTNIYLQWQYMKNYGILDILAGLAFEETIPIEKKYRRIEYNAQKGKFIFCNNCFSFTCS